MDPKEERKAIRQTVEEMLKHARESVGIAEHYEDESKSYLVSARFVLKSVGVETTTEKLREMLSRRAGIYVAADYARLVADELLPAESEEATT